MLQDLSNIFQQVFRRRATLAGRTPGRVNLIGDHTDYNERVDHLIALAQATPGVLGTRMTSGGFGGATVHLVETAALPYFGRAVIDRYRADTGLHPPLYICRAVAGVGPILLPGPAPA